MGQDHVCLYNRSLNASAKEIRLLRLPEQVDDPSEDGIHMSAQLDIVAISDPIIYDALSYTWGASHPSAAIKLNGILCRVGINLHNALQELVRAGYRWIWVDALCINQEDEDEKAIQVKLMGEIYRRAEKVLVWMGQEENNSEMAIAELSRLALLAKSKDLVDGLQMTIYIDDFLSDSIKSIKEWMPLLYFFQRPWWTRVWCLQETALAQEVLVVCGKDRLKWSEIIAALALLVNSLRRWQALNIPSVSARRAIHYCLQTIDRAAKAQYYIWSFYRAFSNLENDSGNGIGRRNDYGIPLRHLSAVLNSRNNAVMGATDARDRIYSLLGLMTLDERVMITVRYDEEWTCRLLFTQAAQLLFRSGDLFMLEMAEKEEPGQMDLPSWVPDWGGQTKSSSISIPDLSSAAEIHPDIDIDVGSGILKLNGILLGEVESFTSTFELCWEDCTKHKERLEYVLLFSSWLQELRGLFVGYRPIYGAHASSEDAVLRVPTLNFLNQTCTKEEERAYQAFLAQSRGAKVETDMAEAQIAAMSPYFERLKIHGRKAFLSCDGQVGLCSRFTREGDYICVFSGGCRVYTVRREGPGRDLLIGPAFLYGIDEINHAGWDGQLETFKLC